MENDKIPLLALSTREFIQALKEGFEELSPSSQEQSAVSSVKKHYVYGYAGLCKLLGCSHSTAWRIKKSGVIDPAISQVGRIIVVDSDLALELLQIRKNVKKCNHR